MTEPDVLLRADAVTVRYDGRAVLDDVSLTVRRGEVLGLIGPNGAGKSTLLRVLARVLRPHAGTVRMAGASTDGDFARAVAYLPQDGAVYWPITIRTLAALGRSPHGDRDEAAIDAALATVDLTALADRPVSQLSGGERARALLARALATRPLVLLADEPAVGLDPAHQLDLMTHFRNLAAGGAGIALVSHDLTLAARYCDRLCLMDRGRIAAEGAPDAVLTDALLAETYGIRAVTGRVEGAPFVLPVGRVGRD